MASPELAVLLYGRRVATLYQDKNGRHELEYADDPGQTPLSLSLPLEQTRHGHRVVNAFLSGLVPDDRAVRARIGDQFGVSGENPYALLEHIGPWEVSNPRSPCAGWGRDGLRRSEPLRRHTSSNPGFHHYNKARSMSMSV